MSLFHSARFFVCFLFAFLFQLVLFVKQIFIKFVYLYEKIGGTWKSQLHSKDVRVVFLE
jgi:hypothetical protein